MKARILIALPTVTALLLTPLLTLRSPACSPAPRYRPGGQTGVFPVVNADQSVIILWDAATGTEHFIRKASFKSEADDFGFLVPTPTRPELSESGNEAFPYLYDLTKPEVITRSASQGVGCGCPIGCGGVKGPPVRESDTKPAVTVVEQKLVAGFRATVLKADSASDLAKWLKENQYAFSPEVQAWAKPYVDAGWMITAFKVAKDTDLKNRKDVSASALRMSFKTDRPLFPYREPDSRSAAQALQASYRLLRIYFLAEARYQGELTKDMPWTGKTAWAGAVSAENRQKILNMLQLPDNSGPAAWWLTEFEDVWPYRVAPADVYFARDPDQKPIKREPIIKYVQSNVPRDVWAFAIPAVVILPPLLRRIRRRWSGSYQPDA